MVRVKRCPRFNRGNIMRIVIIQIMLVLEE